MVDFIHILIGMKYTFMKNASSAPSVWYYEYEDIIIGGGTAGCPLAATCPKITRFCCLNEVKKRDEKGGEFNSSTNKNYNLPIKKT